MRSISKRSQGGFFLAWSAQLCAIAIVCGISGALSGHAAKGNSVDVDCEDVLKRFYDAVEGSGYGMLHVSAVRVITRAEKDRNELVEKLSRDYDRMVSAQGHDVVAATWPSVDDYIAWYDGEHIEKEYEHRELRDEYWMRDERIKFVRTPLSSSEWRVDHHEEYYFNIPKDAGVDASYAKIDHDLMRLHLTSRRQWRVPEYHNMGTYSSQDRAQLLVIRDIAREDYDSDSPMAILCDERNGFMYFSVKRAEWQGRSVFEVALKESGSAEIGAIWRVDTDNLRKVYNVEKVDNGVTIESWEYSYRNGGGDGTADYPHKIIAKEYDPASASITRTIMFDILDVRMDDVDAGEFYPVFPDDYTVR